MNKNETGNEGEKYKEKKQDSMTLNACMRMK